MHTTPFDTKAELDVQKIELPQNMIGYLDINKEIKSNETSIINIFSRFSVDAIFNNVECVKHLKESLYSS